MDLRCAGGSVSLHQLEAHVAYALVVHADLLGRGGADVDAQLAGRGAAVRDAHVDGLAGAHVCHLDDAAEGKGAVGRSHGVVVEVFAAGGVLLRVLFAVPGRPAVLDVARMLKGVLARALAVGRLAVMVAAMMAAMVLCFAVAFGLGLRCDFDAGTLGGSVPAAVGKERAAGLHEVVGMASRLGGKGEKSEAKEGGQGGEEDALHGCSRHRLKADEACRGWTPSGDPWGAEGGVHRLCGQARCQEIF